MNNKKLGRGLEFLLGENAPARTEETANQVETVKIVTNPYQPRREFDEEMIEALAASIKRDGLLQPVVVRKRDSVYELVAGERRLRACRSLGWSSIPATVLELTDADMLQVALAENILRRDLNPIERAHAFARLHTEFKVSHEEIGARLGLDRSTVANFVRLLDLPSDVKDLVSRGTLTMGHARALLGVQDPSLQRALCQEIVEAGLSVREVERRAQGSPKPERKPRKRSLPEVVTQELEVRLQERLGTKVMIVSGKRKGSIVIEYYGDSDLDRLVNQIAPVDAGSIVSLDTTRE